MVSFASSHNAALHICPTKTIYSFSFQDNILLMKLPQVKHK